MNKNMQKLTVVLSASAMMLAGCSGSSGTAPAADGATYTFNTSTSAPNTWSPTDWQNENEGNIQGYTQTPFYSFEVNAAKDGYDIYPAAAVGMPQDVTADLTAEQKALYGVPEDGTGFAWKIDLNEKLTWQDGTKINADTYIYSIQQYLNPGMKNYRASSWYEGLSGLANAKSYYSGGRMYMDAADTIGYEAADYTGALVNTGETVLWWGMSMDDAYSDYGADYFTLEDGTDFFEKYEADTDIAVTEDLMKDLKYLAVNGGDVEENWIEWCLTVEEGEAAKWEDVGLIKNNDYSLTFVLTNPTTEFYVCYAISVGLLYEDLYESCKVTTGDITKSTYGTSAESYMSYGPYKIDSYQPDKEMKYSRNENWFGYSDDHYANKYMTTNIYEQYITENATVLSLFLQGNMDDYGVDTQHMETYANSDYIYFTPTSFSYVFTFNTSVDSLKKEDGEGVNHSILALDDFREAIGLSLDRQSFVTQCLAGSDPGYGLVNYVYVCDPDTGELYRNSDYAKQALMNVYGVDNYDEITGYDKDAASKLFQAAYDQAVAEGLMKETDRVELDYHVYSDTTNNQNRVNFLQSSINEAVKGTSLEGKVTINLLVDEEYYDNCMTGLCDIAFTAWGGADMDPYSIVQCYTDPTYNLVFGYDGFSETATITVDGEEITMSTYDWYIELNEGEYAVADLDVRNQILAGLEEAILNYHGMSTLAYLNEATLYSQRVVLGSDHYINSLVGFGGIEDITYTMTDAEWADYCAKQNNQLTY